ncbi:MAG TPA: hypothetical protein VKR06_25075 [Ktedonosporobacter sp.]|nr:hypothetical protein [Ktedonosporobacter sp.]
MPDSLSPCPTQREQQALTLLQEEYAHLKQAYSDLMGRVLDHMEQFEILSNDEVIAIARQDPRFDRDIIAPTLASSALVALQEWKQQELGVGAIKRHALRVQKAIATLKELNKE